MDAYTRIIANKVITMETLKIIHPVAKKEHVCQFCGCKILPGEKYVRETIKYDGSIYDWICHSECLAITSDLSMLDYAEDGITEDVFQECIDNYISEHHTIIVDGIDDLDPKWYNIPRREQVVAILTEIRTKRYEERYNAMLKNVNNYTLRDCRNEIHRYACGKCGSEVLTGCKDLGVTPFSLPCKCIHSTMMHNDTYTKQQIEELEMLDEVEWWVRPTLKQLIRMPIWKINHVLNGGLVLEKEIDGIWH